MPPVKPTNSGETPKSKITRTRKASTKASQSAEQTLTVPKEFENSEKNAYSIFDRGPDPADIIARHFGYNAS